MAQPMKITRARAAMVQSQRFFGHQAMKLVVREKLNIESLATDGQSLFYNPAWVEAQPMPIVIGVCAKMVSHLAMLHHTRRRSRDAPLWKKACDYAVNPIVIEAGFTLPADALLNSEWDGKSAEDIYRVLAAEQSQSSQGGNDRGQAGTGDMQGAGEPDEDEDEDDEEDREPGDDGEDVCPECGGEDGNHVPGCPEDDGDELEELECDPGNAGQILDAVTDEGGKPSPADMTQIEADQTIRTIQAGNFAKQAGQGSDLADRLITELKKAPNDWVEDTRRFVLARAKDDYSWSKPNRRFIGQGLYLPSLGSNRMGEMVIGVDTSGSVMDWLDDFGANIAAIIEDVRPLKVHVVYATDVVTNVQTFEPDDEFKLEPKGVGGTSFRPVFEWIEREGIDPACLIYLTDLIGAAPDHAPDYPVLWACTSKRTTPLSGGTFGEVIELRR